MLIMAVLLAIAVPAFGPMGRGADLRGAAGAVRNTLTKSRQWAITHRQQVTFNYNSNSYTVVAVRAFVTNTFVLQEPITNAKSVLFAGIGGATNRITFRSDGSLDTAKTDADSLELRPVVGAGGKNIKVNSLSGAVRITDLP